MELYRYLEGRYPVVVSVPHAGTHVPEDIFARFTDPARKLPDTDWHVDRLYAFAHRLGAHMLIATTSRYVVDLNRSPDNSLLYPGKFTTSICPITTFDLAPIYRDGMAPDREEIDARVAAYWHPYQLKLRQLIAELKMQSLRVVLIDAHSIKSVVPSLFEGRLPDISFGTADGVSADKELAHSLAALASGSPYSSVLNGRFKGGYVTRNYGRPSDGVHAVQIELAQHNYMQEAHPYDFDEAKAAQLQPVLTRVVERVMGWVT